VENEKGSGLKWRIDVPSFVIIVSLIIALAVTMNQKASSRDVAILQGRVTTLESQLSSLIAGQVRIEEGIKIIDTRQRDVVERLARIEAAHGIRNR
jgi:hypothetical protein